ncbi:MAG: CRTAC1 family protein [Thermodesulfobacteriota bacterium]
MKFGEDIIATKSTNLILLTIIRRKYLITYLFIYLLMAPLISCTTLHPGSSESASNDYQSRLAQGWKYLNKRRHSQALVEFTKAGVLEPDQSEPVYGRTKALFYMDRFEESLKECAELSGKAEEDFNALGFCWGARIEISRAATATKKEVQAEIETFLDRTAPSNELLYAAYLGYYYLKNEEKRLKLILRLAENQANPALAERISSSLLQEIIAADPDSEQKIILAESYIRNFPLGNMAAKVAQIVLQNLLKEQGGERDLWRIAQIVLKGQHTSPQINRAVARWLIEHGTYYDHAIRLLQNNLTGLMHGSLFPFNQSLGQQEIDKNRLLYNYLLGRAWLGKGELTKARQLLDGVLLKQKNWAGVYHFLGIIALKEERAEQAVQFFATALAKGSDRPETNNHLRVLLRDHYSFAGEPLAYFQEQYEGPRFSDVTKSVGLRGIKARRVAWGDYDNDGDDDLLLDGTRLFANQSPGGFSQRDQIIPTMPIRANGGVWGDYDNDHFLDIFVTSHRGNYLLHNEEGVRFSKSDALSLTDSLVGSTEAAAWGDVNNDGNLDIYVANYEHGTVMRGQCGQDQLLVNKGGAGFKEVIAEIDSEEAMCGRGVIWSDLNGDGRLDILVSNYRLDPNFLWFNQENSSLIDVAESAGVQGLEVAGSYGHSVGSVSGDLDGDGDFDLFTSNLAHPRYIKFSDQSMVLINNGGRLPKFVDHLTESGIIFDETSADPLLFDADYDGDLDLYVTSVYQNRSSHLYINDGKGGFTDQTWLAGTEVKNGWGAASADYDGDGYLDLLVASPEGVRLLHNEGGSHNWLAIRINDHNCNRYGVGSKVIINYGQQSQVREITAGRGTGSQDSLTASFGLGDYTGPVTIQVKTLCGDILHRQTKELNRIVIIENNPKKQ